MTSKQRAYLKGLAMNIEPVFQIGKSGLTPEVTEAVRESFNRKELVKLAVLKNCMEDPNAMGADSCGKNRFPGGTGHWKKDCTLQREQRS